MLILISTASSQCEVDAGLDRNLCPEEIFDMPKLHGNVISGDVVELKWQSTFYEPTLDQSFHASIMLSDTSILEPVIEQHFQRTVKYYLNGLTSTNEVCTDSVVINFSDWMILTIDKRTGKAPTDTIQLYNASFSNWGNIQYEWSPNYMISDTTVEQPLVWNDTAVFYNLIVTDSLGCSVTDDVFEVYTTSSTKDIKTVDFNLYPNPVSDLLSVESSEQVSKLAVYDLQGRLALSEYGSTISLRSLHNGTYLVRVSFANGSSGLKKVLKVESN